MPRTDDFAVMLVTAIPNDDEDMVQPESIADARLPDKASKTH